MKLNSKKIDELLDEYDEHSAIQPKELCDECKEIGFCKSRNQKGYEIWLKKNKEKKPAGENTQAGASGVTPATKKIRLCVSLGDRLQSFFVDIDLCVAL